MNGNIATPAHINRMPRSASCCWRMLGAVSGGAAGMTG
jgi:hypothetical protein